jgi:hypothetical protein
VPQELIYKAPEDREEVRPDGTTTVHRAQDPTRCYEHWRHSYAHSRGRRRKEIVVCFAREFQLVEAAAERILRDDIPHRTEPDSTFIMTVPDLTVVARSHQLPLRVGRPDREPPGPLRLFGD